MCSIPVYTTKDKKPVYIAYYLTKYIQIGFEHKKFKDSAFKYQKLGDIIKYFMPYLEDIEEQY